MKFWWMSRKTPKWSQPDLHATKEIVEHLTEKLPLNSGMMVESMTSSTVPVEIRHFSAEQAALSTGTLCR